MRQAKKTPKGQSCKGFPLHQWGTSMERCIPPPPRANPKTALSLGTESKRSPTVERQQKDYYTDALLLAVPRDA